MFPYCGGYWLEHSFCLLVFLIYLLHRRNDFLNLSFIHQEKSSMCLSTVFLLLVFCDGTKFRFLFNKLKVFQAWPATLLKKRLRHRCFPVNFAKFLRTPFFIKQLWVTASAIFTKSFSLRLITCLAGSDLNPTVSSSAFRTLTKFSRFV